MTLSEIRQKCRSLLDDEVGAASDSYWSNDDLNEYINASIEEMHERTLCVTDSITDAVCLIILVAGQRHYALHESVLDIQTVQPSWKVEPLSKQSIATVSPTWLSETGLPYSYLMDYSHRTLSLTSAPATVSGESLRLTVQRLPLVELVEDTDVPEILKQYHRRIFDGVVSKAYFKQDSEVYNPAKGNVHRVKWESSLEEIIRREARLKPRITIARRVELS